MRISIIKNDKELDKALAALGKLMEANPAPDEKTADEMKLLALVIEEYEKKHYPIPPPDPIEAIKFKMDQMNLRPVDMVKYFGSSGRFYDVIHKKRNLSINMIRSLHDGLKIPAEILIRQKA